MRKFMIGILGGVILSANALASELSFAELQMATNNAIETYSKANPSLVEYVTGIKSWKSADEVRVKVYVNHQGMNMDTNYHCHKHGEIECHLMQ